MKLFNLLEAVSLSMHQRFVMLKLFMSDTPTLGYDAINETDKDLASRNLLHMLGYITVSDESLEAVINETGIESLKEYGLIDDSREVTKLGQLLLRRME